MREFGIWFFLSCKRYLKKLSFFLILLAFPVGAFLIREAEEEEGTEIRIGVYVEELTEETGESGEQEPLEQMLAASLTENEGNPKDGLFQFYLCGSEEQLKEEVASRKAECGYVISENLRNKLDEKDYKRCIRVYSAPSTVLAELSTEVVSAALLKLYDREIFLDYIKESEEIQEMRSVFGSLESIPVENLAEAVQAGDFAGEIDIEHLIKSIGEENLPAGIAVEDLIKEIGEEYLSEKAEDFIGDALVETQENDLLKEKISEEIREKSQSSDSSKERLIREGEGESWQSDILEENLITENERESLVNDIQKKNLIKEEAENSLAENAGALYDKWFHNGSTFRFEYKYRDRQGQEAKEETGTFRVFPVRGIVAVCLFLTGLYSGVMLGNDEASGLFLTVPYGRRWLCQIAALAAPVFLAALSGLGALKVSGIFENPGQEVGILIYYFCGICVFSYALKVICPNPRIICCMIPFFLIGSLIFTPVLVDLRQFFPELEWIEKLFLPSYYLRAF